MATRNGEMLTRSKIKMEESIRHVRGEELPYFNNEEDHSPSYHYKQNRDSKQYAYSKVNTQNYNDVPSKYVGFRTQFSELAAVDQGSKRNLQSYNHNLNQLQQEYQILRDTFIDDNVPIMKKYDHHGKPRLSEENSELSSSVHSKKSSRQKESEVRPVRQVSKEVQTLHLQKKQLEIVIGNSMRKIDELLNNQIQLKKTVHELKSQIDGKGGVHQEYEKMIKGFQKNEEELQNELTKVKHDNEKCMQKIKELTEKIRNLDNQLAGKDRQIKQGFQDQKRLHELIRIEKDKYLNLEIQCKSYKMEFDMLEKEKNNEINRLIRQFESKEGGSEKEMAYMIKKLEDQLSEKDKRYHELLLEKEHKLKEKDSEIIYDKKPDKNYLEEFMYKSRQMSEYNSKALNDSMNMIFTKMAQIEKKNDENLKKEIEALKRKSDQNRRNTNQSDLISRITELEKMIEKEVYEKNRLAEDIKNMKQHKYELEDKNRGLQKKMKELQEKEEDLKAEIEDLEQVRKTFHTTYNEHRGLKEEYNVYVLKVKEFQQQRENHRVQIESISASFRDKEKRYEDEIRQLKRRIDEAQFETEKARKEGEFNINILKSTHESEAKRIIGESGRVSQRLKQVEEELSRIKATHEAKITGKDNQIINLKNSIDAIQKKSQEELLRQKGFYEEKVTSIENRYSIEKKAYDEKFTSISSFNQRLLVQQSNNAALESELIELRRALKQNRSMSMGIDHLWEIKQAEYGNISQILKTMKA